MPHPHREGVSMGVREEEDFGLVVYLLNTPREGERYKDMVATPCPRSEATLYFEERSKLLLE